MVQTESAGMEKRVKDCFCKAGQRVENIERTLKSIIESTPKANKNIKR